MSLYRNDNWEIVIGLEVHAQIISCTKLFSGSPVRSDAAPNTCASNVDLAVPGTLPVLNSHCVDQAIRAGIALGAIVHEYSVFDRKNYFYADLPGGYQISQFYRPIITDGVIIIDLPEGGKKSIRINRVHIEQDAGKSIHDVSADFTCLDFNRAGVPLLEIVTDPDIANAQEAVKYIKKLQMILRYIGVCTGDMEDGALRCDANISVRKAGSSVLGTRCEIKNLNSLSSIQRAIEYEASEQIAIIEDGGSVVQCTKLFDVESGKTKFLRPKENAREYRYFNDPDIPPLVLTTEYIRSIAAQIPELPDAKKDRYTIDYGLTPYDIDVLIADKDTASYFESVLDLTGVANVKLVANWITTELFARLKERGLSISASPVVPARFYELIKIIVDGTISSKIAKHILDEMFISDLSPIEIVDSQDLRQVGDTSAINSIIDEVLSANLDKVTEYRSGKVKLFGYFVGQVMQRMRGKGSPEIINSLLTSKLDSEG